MTAGGPSKPRKPRNPTRLPAQAAWQLQRAKEEAAARAERERLYWPGMAFDERERKTIDEFLEYFTPERMIRNWRYEVKQFGIDPDNVLQTVDVLVRVPEGQRRVSSWPFQYLVKWLPKSQPVDDAREQLQTRVAQLPNLDYVANILMDGSSKGPIYTIEHLVAAKGDPNRVAATFLCASLFQRVEARNRWRGEGWPHPIVLHVMLKWARRFHDCEWHSACTTALPGSMTTTPVTTVDHVIEAFAIEHARALHRCTPVHFRLVTENGDVVHPDPWEEKMHAEFDAERKGVGNQ